MSYIGVLFSFRRYWLEEAEKIYGQNKTVKKLREKIQRAKDGFDDVFHNEGNQVGDENADEDLNGNGAANESDDNVAFWYVFICNLVFLSCTSIGMGL